MKTTQASAMSRRSASSGQHQRGMTLVELMVAVLLGLITTYFIAQVLAVSEGQKRTATHGSDAQVSGALSLYTLQRDIQASGYGIGSFPSALGCPVTGTYGPAGSTANRTFTLAPVVIAAAGSASAPSDSITVLSSSKAGFSAPIDVTENHPNTTNFFAVRSSLGVALGDVLVAVPSAWTNTNGCSLINVVQDTSFADTTLSVTRIPHVPGGTDSWNKDTATVFPAAGYNDSSVLLNLGAISMRTYAVNSDNAFEVTSMSATGTQTTQAMYPQVVLMKVLYGRDANGDGRIDTYDTATPTTAAGWAQVHSIRVAIVSRSSQREKDPVTAAAPQWMVPTGAAVAYSDAVTGSATACAANAATCSLPLTVSHLSDWQNYRYKVYDTVIPLRNVVWNL